MIPQPDEARTADRFRVLFEHSSDAHMIFDETGITDCNAATIELLKATDKSQVLALHPAALSPEYQTPGYKDPIGGFDLRKYEYATVPDGHLEVVFAAKGGTRLIDAGPALWLYHVEEYFDGMEAAEGLR